MMNGPYFELGNRRINPEAAVLVIAEAGVNHNGDPDLALRMVDAAVATGADAVKFQAFRAETLISATAQKIAYQESKKIPAESAFDLLKRLELPDKIFPELIRRCREKNILFLCTPFDEERADFLEAIGVVGFKIGSGEVTHLPFLSHVARKRKPILFSTGMSYLGEIDTALRVMRDAGAVDIALLHCISSYPADPLEANLNAIRTLQAAFQVPVGFSDHSPGLELAPLAVALGARIIEKHFTLDPTLPGPDQKSSLAPPELDRLIRLIRQTERALGDGLKRPMPGEQEVRLKARRSLTAGRDLTAGTEIQARDLIALRPGDHISTADWEQVVGRRLQQKVSKGTFLTREMLI